MGAWRSTLTAMSNADHNDDQQLEAYLDGLLTGAELAAFEAALRADPQRQRQADLQAQIDQSLERQFYVELPTRDQLAAALAGRVFDPAGPAAPRVAHARSPAARRESVPTRRYWVAAAVTAAAAAIGVVLSAPWEFGRSREPHFAARPLADIYRQAVAAGFEPSYDCREPERFAAAFKSRQGQPMRLAAMPDGMQMLGLAYSGGLSRNTTAMLCRVEGEPVMVFVDRASEDQGVADDNAGDDLQVFRQERDGLVFYEVTPRPEASAADLIVPLGRGTTDVVQ
jgi:anti-sigma factor RsiW